MVVLQVMDLFSGGLRRLAMVDVSRGLMVIGSKSGRSGNRSGKCKINQLINFL